jgi:hypothetical protein
MSLVDTDLEGKAVAITREIKGAPVPDEEALQNIQDSALFDLPILAKSKEKKKCPMVFVAGGPTLLDHLEEIREKAKTCFVVTSNNTHDFLVDNGIIPHACLLLDPKERIKDYVKKYQPETQYLVATVCNKGVFQNAVDAGAKVTKVLLGYGMPNDADLAAQTALYKRPAKDFLVGGTMTPLRAMPLAVLMGYPVLEYYGFDSCFSTKEPELVYAGDPRYEEIKKLNGGMYYVDSEDKREYVIDEPPEGGFFYAYKKKRGEHISICITSDGRKFLTSPGFENQARQICKWVERLEQKLKVIIHGDSLSAHLLRVHNERVQKLIADVGDRRWTEEYGAMQRHMHDTTKYGVWGAHNTELVARAVLTVNFQLKRPATVLDYACGNGALGQSLESSLAQVKVTNYDPFHPKWRDQPEPTEEHDVVTCCDVMEHVEIQCVDNTLKWIADRTRYLAVFEIGTDDATKVLPDGRNAHVTQRPFGWWVDKLTKYFVPIEAQAGEDFIFVVCQKRDAKDKRLQEKSLELKEAA